MYRYFEAYLKHWKDSTNRKPLIVRGARQVGKTYTIEKFSKDCFENHIKINLEKNPELRSIFKSHDPSAIIEQLAVINNIRITPGKSLLFIDEIQAEPEAIKSLRYFYEELPGLHVISAGSLLDHTLNNIQYSMPVGRVAFAYMYPLSFTEFLLALEYKNYLEIIDKFKLGDTIGEVIHKKILELLRLYFFIGGMPEAVASYSQDHDLIEIEKIHADLITSIIYDFSKYGTRKQQEYLQDVLQYIATHIGQKVKYVDVNKNVKSSYIKDAFLKLEMSRIVHLIRHTNSGKVPLTQYENPDVFKPVFLDIGLVNHLARIKLIDVNEILTAHEGSLAEQFVFQEMLSSSAPFIQKKLNFWIREAKNSNAEVDCIYQLDNKVFPVEVKAGKRGTLKSLQVYLAEKNIHSGVRLNADLPSMGKDLDAKTNLPGNSEIKYNLISLPLYLAGKLDQILAESGSI